MLNTFTCAQTGEFITLKKQLGKGGEGTVWTTNKPNYCAKVYNSECTTPEREKKLKLMLRHRPHIQFSQSSNTPSLAWIEDILLDSNGQITGFIMPAIKNSFTAYAIYHPKQRQRKRIGCSWYQLHFVAKNIAAVMGDLHKQGYVIGDIKDENILVDATGFVSFIDTDSLQIRDPKTHLLYRCPLGTPGYVPPELFNISFETVERTPTHDAFGLGVLIHQLLFSTSPFADALWTGQGSEPTPEEYVAKGLWTYARSARVKPGPMATPLNIVHPQLRASFHQCFTEGHKDPRQRPTAKQWETALTAALGNLKPCTNNPLHYYHQDEGASHGSCYWCAAAKKLGVDIFDRVPAQKLVGTEPKPEPRQPRQRTASPISPGLYHRPVQQRPPAYPKKQLPSARTASGVLGGLVGILLIFWWSTQQHYAQTSWERLQTTKSCINCTFRNLKLAGVDLSGTDVSGSHFQNTSLVGADFSGANLTETTFKNSPLPGARFHGATLDNSVFKGDKTTRINLRKTNFSQASLVGSTFGHNTDLTEANFNQANLTEAHFKNHKFKGVKLYRASFVSARLDNAYLSYANAARTDFTVALLGAADLTQTDFFEATLDQAHLQEANLTGTKFDSASLVKTDFRGAQFSSTSCKNANLDQASFNQNHWWLKNSDSCKP